MRLFIIRHADPDYPNNTITAAGHLEARALAVRMKKMGLDRIYVSPLGRAIDTMKYTADALNMPYTVADWTTEIADCRIELEPWGDFCIWDVPGELIRASKPYPSHDNWHEYPHLQKPIFREKFAGVIENSDKFLAAHGYEREGGRYRIVKANREKIAIFCHGGFGLWWLAHLLEIPLPLMFSGFFLPPSSVTQVLFDERSSQWAVPRTVGVADLSHLYASGLPMQPSGIKANCE